MGILENPHFIFPLLGFIVIGGIIFVIAHTGGGFGG